MLVVTVAAEDILPGHLHLAGYHGNTVHLGHSHNHQHQALHNIINIALTYNDNIYKPSNLQEI